MRSAALSDPRYPPESGAAADDDLGVRVRQMLRPTRIHRDAAWVIAGQILAALAVLASLKVWSEYLRPAEVGLMGLIVGAASMMVGFIAGPITQAVLVSYAVCLRDGVTHELRTVGWATLFRISGAASIVLIVVGLPASFFLGVHWLTPFFVAGLFLVDARRNFEIVLLVSDRRQRDVALITIGDAWLRLLVLWALLHFAQASAYLAVAAYLCSALAFLIGLRIVLKPVAWPPAPVVAPALRAELGRRLHSIARPLFPAFVVLNITQMSGRYLAGGMLGLSSAGLFIVAEGLVRRPYGMLSGIIDWTLKPLLTTAFARRDPARAAFVRRLWLIAGAGVALGGAVLFFLLGDWIGSLLLSADYADANALFFPLAISMTIWNLGLAFTAFTVSTGRTGPVLVTNIIGCVATVGLVALGAALQGLPGVILGMIGGGCVQLAAAVIAWRRYGRPDREAGH